MKQIFQIITELLRIFRRTYSEVKKKQNEKEIRDVREAISEVDLNSLRDSVLNRKRK